MRFLIDAQLPPALARMLAERDHEAEHVGDLGMLAARDAEIWRYAIEHGATLVTKDEDFADRALLDSSAPAIVWVRMGNTTRRALLERFESVIAQVVVMLDDGDGLVELR